MSVLVLSLCALIGGCLALIWFEARGGPCWLAKGLASTGFIALAVDRGALEGPFGRWIFAALVLSWIGDIALLGAARPAFLAGLGSFLLAHLVFAGAFLVRGVDVAWVLGALAPLLLVGWGVLRWVEPHVPAGMRGPVRAYVAAILVMTTLSFGLGGGWTAAAIAFLASDLSVARHRFIEVTWVNRLWGLPLYYGAQGVFAWGLGGWGS